jgi:triacylglycerol lipase
METLAEAISSAGFRAINVAYPSTSASIEELVALLGERVAAEESACATNHFVGYSLGALVIRAYLAQAPPGHLGRVVMIAPPNHGSEIVDALGWSWTFKKLMGPLATRLGTSPEALSQLLPAPTYPFGVIAGDRIISLWGLLFIRGEQDGTVSVASTRLEGMSDFVVVHRTHTFIMDAPEVAAYTVSFSSHRTFQRRFIASCRT